MEGDIQRRSGIRATLIGRLELSHRLKYNEQLKKAKIRNQFNNANHLRFGQNALIVARFDKQLLQFIIVDIHWR